MLEIQGEWKVKGEREKVKGKIVSLL